MDNHEDIEVIPPVSRRTRQTKNEAQTDIKELPSSGHFENIENIENVAWVESRALDSDFNPNDRAGAQTQMQMGRTMTNDP